MDRETGRFADAISSSVDRVIECLAGLSQEDAHWSSAAPRANSLLAIANHVLANAERNVLATYCGLPYDWNRDAEFLAEGESPESLAARWAELRSRMGAALSSRGEGELVRVREHPRLGEVPGREVLLQAARHAAEHVGEAELTLRLLLASRAGPRTA